MARTLTGNAVPRWLWPAACDSDPDWRLELGCVQASHLHPRSPGCPGAFSSAGRRLAAQLRGTERRALPLQPGSRRPPRPGSTLFQTAGLRTVSRSPPQRITCGSSALARNENMAAPRRRSPARNVRAPLGPRSAVGEPSALALRLALGHRRDAHSYLCSSRYKCTLIRCREAARLAKALLEKVNLPQRSSLSCSFLSFGPVRSGERSPLSNLHTAALTLSSRDRRLRKEGRRERDRPPYG